jgi:N12 class adenine-specific DNA methylase
MRLRDRVSRRVTRRRLNTSRGDFTSIPGKKMHRALNLHCILTRRKVTMNELTKEQADDLRRTAEYLTLQMRLTPHPTERSRIRAMADTVDFVAERIDALLSARSAEAIQPRMSINQLLRRLPLGDHK